MEQYSVQQLAEHFQKMGINKGDTVFARAGLRKINSQDRDTYINALLKAVGPEGTIMTLSFNNHFYFPFFSKKYVFKRDGYTSSGAFPKQMIKHPDSIRSLHPTCSVTAIGKNAKFITEGHDHNATSYLPIKKLIELDGKMIVSGCLEESPGFTTVHYSQEVLGLSKQTLLKNLIGIKYEENGVIKNFYRKDNGGCSLGFGKLYQYYINEGKLKHGFIGDAHTLLIGAKDAFEIDYKVIKNNPREVFCSNPGCLTCRATWLYNKQEMFTFLIFELPKKVFKKLFKKLRK